AEEAGTRCRQDETMRRALASEVDRRWLDAKLAMNQPQVLRAVQVVVRLADQQDEVAVRLEGGIQAISVVGQQSNHADDRRGVDRSPVLGLVVEADIATYHRYAQGPTRGADPRDRLSQLPVALRSLRVAEVQAVGDRQWPGTGGDHVASGFSNCDLAADIRIEAAVAAVAVDGHGQTQAAGRHSPDRRIATPGDPACPSAHPVLAP